MTPLFLETSALLRLVLNQSDAPEVARRIGNASHVTASRLVRVEADRALLRARRDHPDPKTAIPLFRSRLADLFSHVDFIEITREVCDLAGRIAADSRLRTLDAIHLATFELLRRQDPALEMLTYDERIRSPLS